MKKISQFNLMLINETAAPKVTDFGYAFTLGDVEMEINTEASKLYLPEKGIIIDCSAIEDVRKRAIGPNVHIGNSVNIPLLYLAAIACRHPGYSKDVLLNPAGKLKYAFMNFEAVNFKINYYIDRVVWLPVTGVEHPSATNNEVMIPGLTSYMVDADGEVIRVSDSVKLNNVDDNGEKTPYVILEIGGEQVLANKGSIVANAYGKQTLPVSNKLYFMDGDEFNTTPANLYIQTTESSGLSVELQDGDETHYYN